MDSNKTIDWEKIMEEFKEHGWTKVDGKAVFRKSDEVMEDDSE